MQLARGFDAFKQNLGRNLPASFVVFLVALPLCMGISIASGVPPEKGLITGIVGGILVGLIAGAPLQVSGPAAGLAVIVFEFVRTHGFEALGPVLVLAGILQLVAGGLRIGNWFRAISPAVVHGMLAGIGVLIVLGQIHVLTDAVPLPSGLDNLMAIPVAVFEAFSGGNRLSAVMVGLATIAAMLAWERFRPTRLKLLPGALIAVLAGTLLASLGGLDVKRIEVPEAILSTLALPSSEAWGRLAEPAILVMALTIAAVASAESLLSAAAVDRMHDGPRTRYDRELGAQGVGNLVCGLIGGLPMTGVIVRSSANVQAGAVSRASTVLHGIWILAFLVALPWVLTMVPTAALAGILVVTGWRLVGPSHAFHLHRRYGWVTVGIWFVTLVTVVATDLLTGVLTGFGLSLLQSLPALRRGRLRIEEVEAPKQEGVPELRLSGGATFLQLPGLTEALERTPEGGEVRLATRGLSAIDHTCLEVISDWANRRAASGTRIAVVGGSGAPHDRLAAVVASPAH
ncbi:SulP family inorganic anion transporter [Methylobacterium brachythecii]|uniref:MFS superfamily sulfate permease-like transporter n=1 Tax=Methylobacterium brachythecii TaxID=1176177 RepID=A0A7W6AMZ6_9HYPH|nr:SulP family inorganic anion transporter [Methylobacterium brachythecii]MBB3903556.1 MFS superfamily sulfate permease-like transporter [Methylobacterium brachythecii]GLS44092.1 sulfate transporter [Methylobacterium brachythecii]